MTEFLISTGFKQCISDPCLFVNEQKEIYLGLYVDDSPITGPDSFVEEIIKQISKRFKTTNKGPMKKFLGINVDQSQKGIILINQKDYILKILEKCKMTECYPTLTPAIPHSVLAAPTKKIWNDDGDLSLSQYRRSITMDFNNDPSWYCISSGASN